MNPKSLKVGYCPKAPKRVLGSLGEGFGFGGLGFGISLRGSKSLRVENSFLASPEQVQSSPRTSSLAGFRAY